MKLRIVIGRGGKSKSNQSKVCTDPPNYYILTFKAAEIRVTSPTFNTNKFNLWPLSKTGHLTFLLSNMNLHRCVQFNIIYPG